MSGTPSFKLSNVIGAPFKDYVQQQLNTRVKRSARLQRTPNEIIYLANKTAWVKLSSSVNLSGSYVTKLKEYYGEQDGFSTSAVENENLAKNWILQAGTAKQVANPNNPLEESIVLRSGIGLDGAYGLGGVRAQGYRPMPGLDSVVIESAGKLGSLRYANLTFKVWNMNQLDVIDALYFRLGYTMLLEWGHVNYFTNDEPSIAATFEAEATTNLQDAGSLIGTFKTSEGGIGGFFKPEGVVKKEEVLQEINARIIETDGNYDGMLGVVTNFNYNFNQEGGWDCTLRLLGLGSIIETQKLNTTYTMPPWSQKTWDRYVQEIKENVRKKKQAEKDKEAAAAQQAANAANGVLVNGYNKDQPFKNLESFYNSLGTGIVLSDFNLTDNPSVMQALWNKVALTPFVINSADLNDTEVDAQLIPASAIRGAYVNVSGYVTNNNLYAAHVRETAVPNLVASEAGWRYPVQSGATYALDYTLLGNLIAFGRYRKFKKDRPGVAYYTDARANEVLNTTNGLTALGEMLVDYANLYTNNRNGSPSTPFPNLKKLKTQNGSGGSLVVTAEDPSGASSSTDTEIMVIYAPPIDIKIQYGRTDEYVQQKIENPSTPIFDTVVSFKIQALDAVEQAKIDRDFYWPSTSDFASSVRAGFGAVGQETPWTIEEVTIDYDKLKNTKNQRTSNAAIPLFNDPALAKVKLTSVPILMNTKLATSKAGATTEDVALTVTVTIETYVYSILRKLLSIASGATAPPGGAQVIKAQRAELTEAEIQQIERVGGLGSALEAMLSIIQYEGVVQAIKNAATPGQLTRFSTKEFVADFIRSINTAPLKGIFSSTGLRGRADLEADISGSLNNSKVLLTDPYYLGLKGYNTELMGYNKGKSNVTDSEYYQAYPLVDFESLFNAYILRKEFYTSGVEVQNSLAILETPVYVKLGFLFFFINNLCLLYDSTKKGAKESARPHFYIDYNPNTNLCLTTPAHLSVDPTTCLIPYKGNAENYKQLFIEVNNKLPTGSLNFTANTLVTNELVQVFRGSNDYQGRTMEILVNTQYLLDTIKQSVDRDNHNDVYFRPFIDRVLADLNKSTGDVNAFRLGYMDNGNVAAVLDDQYVPPHPNEEDGNVLVPKSNKGNAVLPLFGVTSLARELTIETNISTKMSSMIAIAARGKDNKGSTQSTDASNLHWLSEGLNDRVIEQADDIAKQEPPPQPPPKQQQSKPKDKRDNAQAVSDLFNDHVKSIYSGKATRINKSAIEPSTNFYIQALTKTKAMDEVTRGTPIIPVNISFATDGIAGINMGNVFLVPNDKLPISLRGENDSYRFGFMVMGITHTIQSNQWTTNVKGQIIKLRSGERLRSIATQNTSQNQAPSSNQSQGASVRVNKRIFLSSGHGGTNTGAKGNGYIERDLTIEQKNLIKDELLKLGVQSSDILTDPDTNESDQTGIYGVRQGWNNPDVILCDLHFNAGGGEGTVVLVSDEDAATGKGSGFPTDFELSLAEELVNSITAVSGLSTRSGRVDILSRPPRKTATGVSTELTTAWVKDRGNPYLPLLYRMQDAPTVLIETCFIDSTSDMRKYQASKQEIANAIAKTLLKYAQL